MHKTKMKISKLGKMKYVQINLPDIIYSYYMFLLQLTVNLNSNNARY